MFEENLIYSCQGVSCRGFITYNNSTDKKMAAVLVAHAWKGQDDFARATARRLAKLGYVALALDLYGNGRHAKDDEEASELMSPLFVDRALLRARMQQGYEALKKHPKVEESSVNAIGFCFGGLAVIELLRSGVYLDKAVCFHAVLGAKMHGLVAELQPSQINPASSLLLLHGYEDPLVSKSDLEKMQEELNSVKGFDWQLHVYGGTAHAFTNPEAHDHSHGLVYRPAAAKRGWDAMVAFFKEKKTEEKK